ncbi:MAG: diacylglycerol kinase (ATP) [Myxococcota bacterium]|jgi:diacylglycerol kinase (ATP)
MNTPLNQVGQASGQVMIIVNEHAGGGAMADVFRRQEHALQRALGEFDVAFTDGPGDATALTREALTDGFTTIVSAGGDGTLNEVVNGFFGDDGALINPEAALGLLNGGTGGDFRRTLRIGDTDHAIAVLSAGKTLRCDVGRITFADHQGETRTRFFINIASFGLSGAVVSKIPQFKQLGGSAAYMAATLSAMWSWRNPRVRLSVDDHFEAELPITTVAVGNGRFFGGGMMITPDATVISGELDVTVLADVSRFDLLMLTKRIYDGTHIYTPKVISQRGKIVTAEAVGDTPILIDLDGEGVGRLPARFEVVPNAINVLVP